MKQMLDAGLEFSSISFPVFRYPFGNPGLNDLGSSGSVEVRLGVRLQQGKDM